MSKTIESIKISPQLAAKLAIKDGTLIQARFEKGKLFILNRHERKNNIMKYAGIWESEEVDTAFKEIRRDWKKWRKDLPV